MSARRRHCRGGGFLPPRKFCEGDLALLPAGLTSLELFCAGCEIEAPSAVAIGGPAALERAVLCSDWGSGTCRGPCYLHS